MKRILTLIMILGAGCGTAFAQNISDKTFNLSFWGGYASVAMSDVNNDMDAVNRAAANLGTVTKIDNALALAAEGTFNVAPGLSVGPRIEYLICNQGKVALPVNILLNTERKTDLSLVPIMLGGRYVFLGRDRGFSLSAGAFAGWGLAYGKTSVTASSGLLGLPASTESFNYSGGGFVGNVILGALIRLSSTVSLGIDAGYRYAPIPEMKATEDTTGIGIRKDDVINDTSGNKLKFDFSGVLLNAGIHFAF